MGCRKNQATLTPAERTAFANAVLKLKNETPSQMGLTNRYDEPMIDNFGIDLGKPDKHHHGKPPPKDKGRSPH